MRTEIAYQNGVQHSSGNNTSFGAGLIGGRIGVGLMNGKNSGKSVSDMARSLAPPDAPLKPWWLSSWMIVLMSLFFGFSGLVESLTSLLSGRLFIRGYVELLIFVIYIVACRNKSAELNATKNTYPDEFAHWQREWFCPQCGLRWAPDQGDAL